MDERTAEHLAAIMGGEAWERGGDWRVSVERDDGSLVVFSGEGVREYEDEAALDAGRPAAAINLEIPEKGDLYVIVDLEGNVFYRDDDLRLGWPDEYEAEHEARGLESRGEGRFTVVQQSEVSA